MVIQVCIGSACHLKGSYAIINQLESLAKDYYLDKNITIKAAFCLEHCTEAVSVKVDDKTFYALDIHSVDDFFHNIVRKQVK
ncbi:NADH dehydrogenase subunit E [Natranaerovirga hydrolytica]|uniref:NADH dehydrogenase subunit E n=2 Tax=Natranaerovirga hydrolytica TaxID=680378 RepID=A0A4R1N145_9FIRM|nr:NADH dehydrogenase subunit E [Natranaerovirga hydrolytica]